MKLNNKELIFEEYIKKSINKFNDNFIYKFNINKDIDEKFSIKCKTCNNILEQSIFNHFRSKGCKKCVLKELNQKIWIEKLEKKFGKGKYNFKELNFKDRDSQVIIHCNDCGFKNETTAKHFLSKGCKKCFNPSYLNVTGKTLTKKQFENKVKSIYKNNEFNISISNYLGIRKTINIKCNRCNEIFETTPRTFLNGKGCLNCDCQEIRTQKNFLDSAKEIHGDEYNYSNFKYLGTTIKSIIICKEHGEFLQNSHQHISKKSKCPKCSISGFKFDKPGILYYILIDRKYYKIGITNNTIKERFRQDFDRIEVIKEWYYDDGEECYNMEQYYLKEFDWARLKNISILNNGGNTELFDRDILNLDI